MVTGEVQNVTIGDVTSIPFFGKVKVTGISFVGESVEIECITQKGQTKKAVVKYGTNVKVYDTKKT